MVRENQLTKTKGYINATARYWLAGVVLISTGIAYAGDVPTEADLRRAVAWQVALDRVGFSPGVIDGRVGPKTRLATREFQRVRSLPQTGRLDDETSKALQINPDNVLGRYTIQRADLAQIGPVPKSWLARSKLHYLGHETLTHVLAEKFHCARHLLETLNRGKNISAFKPGDKVVVPAVTERDDWPKADHLEVNLAGKVIRAIGPDRKLLALFHCSVAAKKSKLPTRDARIVVVAKDPSYTFNPKMYPEVKEPITTKLLIPPGPRNPVGRCWMGLSLPGYGMHGTPNPELIGKTGSHGCFRLANWDAIRLSKMVSVGTPVRFVNKPEPGLAP